MKKAKDVKRGIVSAAESPEEDKADVMPEGEQETEAIDAPEQESAEETTEEPSEEPGEESPGKLDLESQLHDGADEPNVTPEEQKMYDTFMLVVHQRMYSKTAFPLLLKKITEDQQDIGFSIGHTGAMLMQSALATIRHSGKNVPDDILMAAAEEILSDLLDIAEGAHIIKAEDRDKVGTRALYEGMKIFGNNLMVAGVDAGAREDAKKTLAKLGVTPEQASGNSAPASAANAYKNMNSPAQEQVPQGQPQQAPQQGGVVNAAQQGA